MEFQITCDFAQVPYDLFDFDKKIAEGLNEIFQLAEYGAGIKEFGVIYKVYPETLLGDGILEEDLSRYYPRKKTYSA